MDEATPDVRKVPSSEYKVFNDPVHGKIRLHPLLVHIIDTPQFQRLRNIKQLGGVYFVYPGASHNRFEHSIGTCHLAGLLARHLQKQLEEEKQSDDDVINEKDILCVEIAALCHDLGHGPFSHAFDNNFIKKVNEDTDWTHEKMSIELLKHMLSSNDNNKLKDAWKNCKMTEEDKEFISNLINPPDEYWNTTGFKPKKGFLYEIVSNKITGIDVDKFDYFARDALYMGLRSNFDHMRYIYSARVLTIDKAGSTKGNTRICCREKDLESLYDLFHTRHLLHRRAYQHKNTIIIEEMIIEAFVEANKTKFFSCPSNEKMRLSETIKHPEAYTYVTDHVFHQILCSTDDNGPLKIAREILDRVNKRELYTCIGIAYFVKDEENMKQKQILEKIWESAKTEQQKLNESEIILESHETEEQKLDGLKNIWKSGMTQQRKLDRLKYIWESDMTVQEKLDKLKKIWESDMNNLQKFDELKNILESQSTEQQKLDELKKIWESDKFINEILNESKNDLKENLVTATSLGLNQFIVTSINMNYGKKNNDPLKKLTFYRKAKKNELIEVGDDQAVSEMIKPKVFMEHRIVAYCKDKAKKVDCQTAFVEWCKDKKYPHLIDV